MYINCRGCQETNEDGDTSGHEDECPSRGPTRRRTIHFVRDYHHRMNTSNLFYDMVPWENRIKTMDAISPSVSLKATGAAAPFSYVHDLRCNPE